MTLCLFTVRGLRPGRVEAAEVLGDLAGRDLSRGTVAKRGDEQARGDSGPAPVRLTRLREQPAVVAQRGRLGSLLVLEVDEPLRGQLSEAEAAAPALGGVALEVGLRCERTASRPAGGISSHTCKFVIDWPETVFSRAAKADWARQSCRVGQGSWRRLASSTRWRAVRPANVLLGETRQLLRILVAFTRPTLGRASIMSKTLAVSRYSGGSSSRALMDSLPALRSRLSCDRVVRTSFALLSALRRWSGLRLGVAECSSGELWIGEVRSGLRTTGGSPRHARGSIERRAPPLPARRVPRSLIVESDFVPDARLPASPREVIKT
jgi:hypothetical protein